MKYRYFVSYHVATSDGGSGFGDCVIARKKKIEDYNDLKAIADLLKKENNLWVVTILNFILLSKVRNSQSDLKQAP